MAGSTRGLTLQMSRPRGDSSVPPASSPPAGAPPRPPARPLSVQGWTRQRADTVHSQPAAASAAARYPGATSRARRPALARRVPQRSRRGAVGVVPAPRARLSDTVAPRPVPSPARLLVVGLLLAASMPPSELHHAGLASRLRPRSVCTRMPVRPVPGWRAHRRKLGRPPDSHTQPRRLCSQPAGLVAFPSPQRGLIPSYQSVPLLRNPLQCRARAGPADSSRHLPYPPRAPSASRRLCPRSSPAQLVEPIHLSTRSTNRGDGYCDPLPSKRAGQNMLGSPCLCDLGQFQASP